MVYDPKIVRVADGPELEQLRALLEAIRGEPVSSAEAVGAAITQLRASLGEGQGVAMFEVSALQRLMAARTRSVVGSIAAAVAAAVTEYLHRAGVDAELVVGVAEDGGTVAAKVVSSSPLPDVYPVADSPIIEA